MKKIFLLLIPFIALNSALAESDRHSPEVVSCTSMVYPKEAQVRGEEGTVELQFELMANAKVGSIMIRKSSGFASLDEAAIDYIKSCSYKAAIKDSISINSLTAQKIVFRLVGDASEIRLVKNNNSESERRLKEANLARMARLAGTVRSDPASIGSPQPAPGYPALVKRRIIPHIVFAKEVDGNPRAEVEVTTASDGNIIGVRLLSSSGDSDWDQAVLKAVIRAKSLPFDSNGNVPPKLIIHFRPKD